MSISPLGIRFDPYSYYQKTNPAERGEGSPEVEETAAGSTLPQSNFKTKDELMSYLKENYKIVASGSAQISGSYLNKCLTDESERERLFENLRAADEALERAPDEIKGFQGMSVSIDENGDMTTSSSGGWVSVNVGKRVRQIAAAKTPAQIQTVMSMLDTDLSQVRDGKAQGMSDDEEIAKVEALMRQAQARAAEIGSQSDEARAEAEKDMGFYTTLLM
ncbi:MAG: hypothetical protein NC084_09100 [Bacteroides sp.]|nr:hypothetical protein [Eubacterium sp.]MCM1419026.1 hypothetical protein [Roseburia sp.]MCM1462852.1 hypothetical protein [Bacteroides sp.]